MPVLRRPALIAASLVALACASQAIGQAQEQPSQPWAHTVSDLKPDQTLRFGTLPNGMRYVIRRNATPPGQVALRVRIDAGSLVEKDDQRGLAHFMEHMTFNGTTNLPGAQLVQSLERLGLSFGGDINASTSQDETIYMLNVPRNDPASLQTALHVLREQISETVMRPAVIDEERGVVAGERRLQEGTQIRSVSAQLGVVSSRLAERLPIGDAEVIRTAPRERFAEFYNAYYRPSRATLVAVGDFDPDAMEALIRRNFADWKPRGAAGRDNDAGRFTRAAPTVTVFQDPGASHRVVLLWKRAPDLSPTSQAKRHRDIQRFLGLSAVGLRLRELARSEAPPFANGSARDTDYSRLVDVASFAADYNAGGLNKAITALEQEQRRMMRYGISEDELKRQIASLGTSYRNAAAAAATRSTPALAEQLVSDVNGRDVTLSPQQDLELFEAAVKGLTAAQVNGRLRELFSGGEPSVFVMTPTPIVGGEAAIARQLAASRRVAVSAPVKQAKKEWAYTDFGPAGIVASRRVIPEIETTLVTFANGTTLAVKPTKFTDKEIMVSASTGLGELGMTADRYDPLQGAKSALVAGGLGKLTAEEVDRTLSGHTYEVTASIQQNRFSWRGTTRFEELPLQMQVLAAYVTDAALRPAPLEREKARYAQFLKQARNTPSGAFDIDGTPVLTGGDRRAVRPSAQEFAALDMNVIRQRFREATARGPIHVVMVGDVTVDDAIAATASTFGALLPRGPKPVPALGADRRAFPAGGHTTVMLHHDGDPSQGLAFIGWRGPDSVEGRTEARRATLMGSVLQLRVLDEIRERLALAYSPGAGLQPSSVYRDAANIAISAETAPDKIDAFYAAVDKIVGDLKAGPVSQDELDRARSPLLEQLSRARATNEYWMTQLMDLPSRPALIEEISTAVLDVQAVEPADIPMLARKYLKPEAAWRAAVTPRPGASAVARPPVSAHRRTGSSR